MHLEVIKQNIFIYCDTKVFCCCRCDHISPIRWKIKMYKDEFLFWPENYYYFY